MPFENSVPLSIITLNKNLQPSKPIEITINYYDSYIEGNNENNFIVCRYDENSKKWLLLSSTPEPNSNKVSATTNHLSVFQLAEKVSFNNIIFSGFLNEIITFFLCEINKKQFFLVHFHFIKRRFIVM